MLSRFRPGLRTLKTGLSVFLAFAICDFFAIDNVLLVSITAALGIHPSLKGTLKSIRNEVLAAIAGCVVGGVFAMFFPGNYLVISLGIIVVLIVTNNLRMQNSFSIILFSILIISTSATVEGPQIIFIRIGLILLGQAIALVVNLVIPPRYDQKIFDSLGVLRELFEEFFHDCIDDLDRPEFISKQEIKRRTAKIRDEIQEVRRLYIYSTESSPISSLERTDEKYLIRRAINAVHSNLERLLEIHHNIVFAPFEHGLRLKLRDYLILVLFFHKWVYDHLMEGREIDKNSYEILLKLEKALESELLSILKETDNIEVLQYYNIFAEGKRILRKCWNIIKIEEERGIVLSPRKKKKHPNKKQIKEII